MRLNNALADIATIRAQLGRVESYRGFRALTVVLSGLVVFFGAVLQLKWQSSWEQPISCFFAVWLSVAIISLIAAGFEMWIRGFRHKSRLIWLAHRDLIVQIAPSFVVGAVVTAGFYFSNFEQSWMLPGLWALIYGLGLFSCRHNLPPATLFVVSYFLIGGAICLFTGHRSDDTMVWQMVILFGVGQLMLGWILYWKLERRPRVTSKYTEVSDNE